MVNKIGISIIIILLVLISFLVLVIKLNSKEKEILSLKNEISEKSNQINLLSAKISQLEKEVEEKKFLIESCTNEYVNYQKNCNKQISMLKESLKKVDEKYNSCINKDNSSNNTTVIDNKS